MNELVFNLSDFFIMAVLCLSGLEEKAIPEDKTSGSGFFYFSAFSRAVRMVLMSIMEVYWLSSE